MKRFVYYSEEDGINRERKKARFLRKSTWWKRKCSKRICYYCGNFVLSNNLTMDHIVPLARGGKTTKGNVVPACKDCNTKKKMSLLMEWKFYFKK